MNQGARLVAKCIAEGCTRRVVTGFSYCSEEHYDQLVEERKARNGYRMGTTIRGHDYTKQLSKPGRTGSAHSKRSKDSLLKVSNKSSLMSPPRKTALLAPEKPVSYSFNNVDCSVKSIECSFGSTVTEKPKLAETTVIKHEDMTVGDDIETYGDFVDKATVGYGKLSSKEIAAIKPYLVFRVLPFFGADADTPTYICPVTFHDMPFITHLEWVKLTGMSNWPRITKERVCLA